MSTLIARIERFGDNHYLAYIESMKGMMEESDSIEGAMKELLISLRVKLAYDLNTDYENLTETCISEKKEYIIEKKKIEEVGYAEHELQVGILA